MVDEGGETADPLSHLQSKKKKINMFSLEVSKASCHPRLQLRMRPLLTTVPGGIRKNNSQL